jgi:transposase, IS30 family
VGLKTGRRPVPRVKRVEFWELVRAGVPWRSAARGCGLAEQTAQVWFVQAGGVTSLGTRPVGGRYLSAGEREEIALGLAAGRSLRSIAAGLGRPASTVCREVARNRTTKGRYLALAAQVSAEERARRPKVAKLAADPVLRERVQHWLGEQQWSPRQISARLAIEFPDRPEMRVSHETIYQSLYVQGRGALRRELAVNLRTGRALRKPRRAAGQHPGQGKLKGMVMISDRPPEAEDRAVPGHWEGDLILGKDGGSAIGTLVERSTRFCLLLHLPGRRDAATVAEVMTATMSELPAQLRRSLTWDQGSEMGRHAQITLATGLAIYFCDPHSPWQRGSNENTNGLLRQYFPKGTVLSRHSQAHLDEIAAKLNGRPRQTLGFRTPAEVLNDLLLNPPDTSSVATTP